MKPLENARSQWLLITEKSSFPRQLPRAEEEARIARKYTVPGYGADDLISIVMIGLIKTVNSCKPHSDTVLGTYAPRCIENTFPRQCDKRSPAAPASGVGGLLGEVKTEDGQARYAPLAVQSFRVNPRKPGEKKQKAKQEWAKRLTPV